MGSSNSALKSVSKKHIISAKELAAGIFDSAAGKSHKLNSEAISKVRLIDASAGGAAAKTNFAKAALPSARFLNVVEALVDKTGKFPNTFPTKEIVKNELQKLGVEKDDLIVLYAQEGKTVGVTRAFAILSIYGFKNVKILDGGLKKYRDEGYPTEPGKEYEGSHSKLDTLADPKSGLVTTLEVAEFALGLKSDTQLVDTRPASAFRGEATDNIAGCLQGHVPHSVNIPGGEFLHSGTDIFKKDNDLKELIKDKLDPKKTTIVMCRTGMMATIAYASLKDLGAQSSDGSLSSIKLYDGSWSEYGSTLINPK
mmetsp:Transcript_34475/g.39890  ORF Transcript_34475/g.39890 Transcript_34475/m.39890 type:complete len:311 (-) Transcript_34475:23-955(-)